MSDRDLLRETAARLFADTATPEVVEAARGGWADGVWDALSQAGMARLGVPEELGGDGGELQDAVVLVAESAAHAAPVPVADTALIAGWLCERSGLTLPPGAVAVAPDASALTVARDGDDLVVRGTLARVPWASVADHVLAVVTAGDDELVMAVPVGELDVAAGANLAGEPRDTLALAEVRLSSSAWAVAPAGTGAALELRGAFTRTVQMAAGLRTVLDLTVRYAQEREQFGRPIGRFQAVRQLLARLAAQAAMATAAAAAVTRAVAAGDAEVEIAAAKASVGAAVTEATQIAHQVHGAIGMTDEHVLHHYSLRLWSWRDEYGNEARWGAALDERLAGAGADALWPLLTLGSNAGA